MKKRKIGLIGFGGIAKGTHANGYLNCADKAEVVAVCDTREEALALAKEKLGIPEEYCFKDYKELIACDAVEAVDICTPNFMHCEIAEAAIAAGKPYSVEKPVGLRYAEVLKLQKKTGELPAFVSFSFRFQKTIRYMQKLIADGVIGDIKNVYIRYYKDSALRPGRRLEWRFDEKLAGTGALGDFGSHMVDTARLFCGDFEGVYAESGIVVKERQKLDSEEIAPVTTDDWCNILARTVKGAGVSISVSRCTRGIKMLTEMEIFGTKGSLLYSSAEGLRVDRGEGPAEEEVPDTFLANQAECFVDYLNGKTDALTPYLSEGLACQKILEAASRSIETGKYIHLDEI
ncbi:MAG: Gfo/Idh/MocA family oxidoreductase [Clostridia bacterium]|nr:Gfo/Idh/MocA family oxidoreductase [Clostridia bacterium]